ncbi:hypothetical protein V1477_010012 [Vespula maculifrons]|uniref:Uncharacterized protein n=1 Tax=Vespula maculifrons TaxID=7453 RepID=A0ABD2CDM2_VESMC
MDMRFQAVGLPAEPETVFHSFLFLYLFLYLTLFDKTSSSIVEWTRTVANRSQEDSQVIEGYRIFSTSSKTRSPKLVQLGDRLYRDCVLQFKKKEEKRKKKRRLEHSTRTRVSEDKIEGEKVQKNFAAAFAEVFSVMRNYDTATIPCIIALCILYLCTTWKIINLQSIAIHSRFPSGICIPPVSIGSDGGGSGGGSGGDDDSVGVAAALKEGEELEKHKERNAKNILGCSQQIIDIFINEFKN